MCIYTVSIKAKLLISKSCKSNDDNDLRILSTFNVVDIKM